MTTKKQQTAPCGGQMEGPGRGFGALSKPLNFFRRQLLYLWNGNNYNIFLTVLMGEVDGMIKVRTRNLVSTLCFLAVMARPAECCAWTWTQGPLANRGRGWLPCSASSVTLPVFQGYCLSRFRLLLQILHRLAASKQQKCITISSGGRKVKTGVPSMVRFWWGPLTGCRLRLPIVSHMTERGQDGSLGSYQKTPFMKAAPSSPNLQLNYPTPNTIHTGD